MRGGADAQIVQGLMSVTAMAVNGMNPEEVSTMSPDYADAMGIRNSLTPSRANGFLNMFERVRSEAERMVLSWSTRQRFVSLSSMLKTLR